MEMVLDYGNEDGDVPPSPLAATGEGREGLDSCSSAFLRNSSPKIIDFVVVVSGTSYFLQLTESL
jgi:hypothetical protein